jgi:glucose/arabinose dehydrogenase
LSDTKYVAIDRDINPDGLNGGTSSKYSIYKLNLSNTTKPEVLDKINIELPEFKDERFRILDLKVYKDTEYSETRRVYISYASMNFETQCRHLNLLRLTLADFDKLKLNKSELIFRSPCFPASAGIDTRLHQSGGRILELQQNSTRVVFLTIGDFINLSASGVSMPPGTSKYLGAIISIDERKKIEIFAKGFRNPQGLTLLRNADRTEMVATGHGPRGGDELNIVRENRSYGWPEFSYGTRYIPIDPLGRPKQPNTAGDSEKPLFSWLPSIGVSSVHQIESSFLKKLWADASTPQIGDLLVAGMANGTLNRLRVMDDRVIYSEAINVGVRTRSIYEEKSGRIILGTDSGTHILESVAFWSIPKGTFVPIE